MGRKESSQTKQIEDYLNICTAIDNLFLKTLKLESRPRCLSSPFWI